jgi:molybdenum cofactor cytidylyltransferase
MARVGLDNATALVALSHDPKLDDPALELALPSDLFYIGALGSRRTHEKRLERLRAAGLSELTGRIHSPVGLDLGGRSPSEIAVSILAQIIQTRYRKGTYVIFREFPLAECEGLLLAHSLRLPDRILKKGLRLTRAHSELLAAAGIAKVHGARLAADEIDENSAAEIVATVLGGPGITPRAPNAGRCNLNAAQRGLVAIDAETIHRLNGLDESITVATLPPYSPVRSGAVVATVKIIPLAVSRALVDACITQAQAVGINDEAKALQLLPFQQQRAGLIVTEQQGESSRNYIAAVNSTRRRLEDLGSHLGLVQRCAHRENAVAAALQEMLAAGCTLILVSGSTVPKDRADTVPVAIVTAGGEIVHFGMPVEPGNMLLLARIGAVPVIVLPGCARSRRTNGLDWVLQRMLAGLPMGAEQIMGMGVGGLIRSPLESDNGDQKEAVRISIGRRIGALILAAGSSRRMGSDNKLLQPVGGVPMVRRVANAALTSRCSAVRVVTGFAADAVQECLAGLDVTFTHNTQVWIRHGIVVVLRLAGTGRRCRCCGSAAGRHARHRWWSH